MHVRIAATTASTAPALPALALLSALWSIVQSSVMHAARCSSDVSSPCVRAHHRHSSLDGAGVARLGPVVSILGGHATQHR
jgi:hypothetical protein